MKNKILPLILTLGIGAGCSNIRFGKKPENENKVDPLAKIVAEYTMNEGKLTITSVGNFYDVNKLAIKDDKLLILYNDRNKNNIVDGFDMLRFNILKKDCKYKDEKWCFDSFNDNGLVGKVDLYHTHKNVECNTCDGKVDYITCYHVSDAEHKNEIPEANEKYSRLLRKINQKIEQVKSKAKSTKLHKVYK